MKIDNYPMTENQILKKLRLIDQNPVLIINAPEEFQETQKHIRSDVHRQTIQQYGFILVFVKNQADINQFLPTSLSALQGDGYFWVAYPKKHQRNTTVTFPAIRDGKFCRKTITNRSPRLLLIRNGSLITSSVSWP